MESFQIKSTAVVSLAGSVHPASKLHDDYSHRGDTLSCCLDEDEGSNDRLTVLQSCDRDKARDWRLSIGRLLMR